LRGGYTVGVWECCAGRELKCEGWSKIATLVVCTLYLSDITSTLRVVLSVAVACSPQVTSSEARLQCVLKRRQIETKKLMKREKNMIFAF
jgi:hypothetical protein